MLLHVSNFSTTHVEYVRSTCEGRLKRGSRSLPTKNAKFLFQTLRETSPADADAAPEDPVRAEQGRPEVVAESNSNPVDADAAPEDPVRAKQSRLEELKRNVAGSDCKSFR
ncbi:hypothetical protein EAI_14097 [Harpegnathos saltator]|uniref:Uncharacterized protein n=1 Tax=Harpegnathos saltator TaxID=610380 RepID=E2BQW2_HARSA|nr:hypothetical protein EAI_14097 [Harpegnathos saltator]